VADLAEADRLVDQMGENDHRAGLTTGERVAAFAQLSALGVSAAQIAKRTATKRADVDAALTVAGSGIATGAVERWDFLTLDQSAVLADFEDEPDTVTALVAAARSGQFEHVAQRARDARTLRRQGEQITADLSAQGIPVIDRPRHDERTRSLGDLLDAQGEPLTPEAHAECPGRAAYVRPWVTWTHEQEPEDTDDVEGGYGEDEEEDEALAENLADDGVTSINYLPASQRVETMQAVHVCTDPKGNGHTDRYAHLTGGSTRPRAADMSETEREQARAERRDVIESNRAWASAETVRRDWLRAFATRKSAPKDAPQFITTTLLDGWALSKARESGHRLACDLLGADSSGYGRRPVLLDERTTGPRAQVITLVLLLAAAEEATGKHSWRNVSADTARYLHWIEAQGYTLSDVERRACGQDPLPQAPAEPEDRQDEQDQPDE
ncbi:hypothetical protein, partial [Pseudokineococcus sp. 1T1Z-3]|uniref:hypothetical protein n=1 Tax=Pseudokineococcus sp. 1T1Z-3 TaxID=3132745 RepID=UPI0030A9B8C0